MFRTLFTRAKSAWQQLLHWIKRRFSRDTPPLTLSAADVAAPIDGASAHAALVVAEPEASLSQTQQSPLNEPLVAEPPAAFAYASSDSIDLTQEVADEIQAARESDDVDELAAPPAPALLPARWLEGNAYNAAGRMVPWVLVPPERHYRLYIPASDAAQKDRAMVMMIHGCRQDAATFAHATRMNALADLHGFAVLYPDQSDLANIRRCWNWFESQTLIGRGEVALMLTMIDRAAKRANVDLDRVSVAGLSSGGALASLLAFSHPERFYSVIVHSGLAPHAANSLMGASNAMHNGANIDIKALTRQYWSTQQLPPPPLLAVHGDADDRVNPKNADILLDLWASLHQAEEPQPLTRSEREVNATPTQRAHHTTRVQAGDQVIAESVRVHGLAHAWSGGDASLPFNDALGPSASSMIVAFAGLDRRVSETRPAV